MLKRIGIALFAVGALAALVLATAYFFGSMERPDPAMRAAFEELVAQGRAAPVARVFTVPIPGCRCHSTDPVLTMQHSVYRIRECKSCHGG